MVNVVRKPAASRARKPHVPEKSQAALSSPDMYRQHLAKIRVKSRILTKSPMGSVILGRRRWCGRKTGGDIDLEALRKAFIRRSAISWIERRERGSKAAGEAPKPGSVQRESRRVVRGPAARTPEPSYSQVGQACFGENRARFSIAAGASCLDCRGLSASDLAGR